MVYWSTTRESQSLQEQTAQAKDISLPQQVVTFIGDIFSASDEESRRITQEIAARENILSEMDKALPGIIEQANNVKPLCSSGSVTVGEIDDPRAEIRQEIAQLKQQMASLKK